MNASRSMLDADQLRLERQLRDPVDGHPVAPLPRARAEDVEAARHLPEHPPAELVVLLRIVTGRDRTDDSLLRGHARRLGDGSAAAWRARSASRCRPTSRGRSSADHTAALAARTAAVGRAASASARASVRARSSARGHDLVDEAAASASLAVTRSPVMTAASAALVPTTRGKVWLAPPAGSMPDARFGQRDHAVVGGDAQIALQRELEAESHRVALHRREHRHRDRAQQSPHVASPPCVTHREQRRRSAELLEVGTGREVVTGGGEDDDPHAGIGDDRGEHLAQRVAGGDVVDVDRWVVELDLGDRATRGHAQSSATARSRPSRRPTAPSSETRRTPPRLAGARRSTATSAARAGDRIGDRRAGEPGRIVPRGPAAVGLGAGPVARAVLSTNAAMRSTAPGGSSPAFASTRGGCPRPPGRRARPAARPSRARRAEVEPGPLCPARDRRAAGTGRDGAGAHLHDARPSPASTRPSSGVAHAVPNSTTVAPATSGRELGHRVGRCGRGRTAAAGSIHAAASRSMASTVEPREVATRAPRPCRRTTTTPSAAPGAPTRRPRAAGAAAGQPDHEPGRAGPEKRRCPSASASSRAARRRDATRRLSA